MSEFIMQIRRTAGLREQFFSGPGILQSLLKITGVLLKHFHLRNLNKFCKSYIEFYIPAHNCLLLTLLSSMSTLRLPKSKSLELTAKLVEALLKLIDFFSKDSNNSFQLWPITCSEVLQEIKKLRSDCSCESNNILVIFQKFSFKALPAPCTSSESWLPSTFFGGVVKDTVSAYRKRHKTILHITWVLSIYMLRIFHLV